MARSASSTGFSVRWDMAGGAAFGELRRVVICAHHQEALRWNEVDFQGLPPRGDESVPVLPPIRNRDPLRRACPPSLAHSRRQETQNLFRPYKANGPPTS